jgi:hypothetical protein
MFFLHSIPTSEIVPGAGAGVGSGDSVEGMLAASPDLLRAENRSRSSMRVTFADMKANVAKTFGLTIAGGDVAAAVAADGGSPTREATAGNRGARNASPSKGVVSTVEAVSDTAPLSEHIELRGFLPCAASYEVRNSNHTSCTQDKYM